MTLRDNLRIGTSSSLDRQAPRVPISPSDTAIANYAGRDLQPNRGVPLNLDWVNAVRVNTSAVERRAQTIGTRRTVKKEWQAAWLLRAITSMDLKVFLGTGELLHLRNVARASIVAMMAGADFIKTSTGKEAVNATLPVSLVMTRAIREYAQETGMAVGFKPAGGIRTAKQSLDWLALMKEELGDSWLKAELFRFGASGMLADIERQLEAHATGRYSADYRHPIG